MQRIPLVFAILMATTTSYPAFSREDEVKPAVPPTVSPTAIEREENNPAKAAVAAKEALRKAESDAEQDRSIAAPAAAKRPPVEALMRSVNEALRKDERTVNLRVELRQEGEELIGLHGVVPSRQSRAAAESVAAKVAGPGRIQNHLVVPVK